MKKTITYCDLCLKTTSIILVREDSVMKVVDTIDICNPCFDTITLFLHESVFIKDNKP